jgi:hypothetical protein
MAVDTVIFRIVVRVCYNFFMELKMISHTRIYTLSKLHRGSGVDRMAGSGRRRIFRCLNDIPQNNARFIFRVKDIISPVSEDNAFMELGELACAI